jgi:hypothetical protein
LAGLSTLAVLGEAICGKCQQRRHKQLLHSKLLTLMSGQSTEIATASLGTKILNVGTTTRSGSLHLRHLPEQCTSEDNAINGAISKLRSALALGRETLIIRMHRNHSKQHPQADRYHSCSFRCKLRTPAC